MRQRVTGLSAFAAMGLAVASAVRGATIIQDTFTQNPGALANRPVETPQTTGDEWSINNTPSGLEEVGGGALTVAPTSTTQSYAKAVCPFFSSEVSSTYTLSFNLILFAEASGASAGYFVYGGLGNGTGSDSGFNDGQGGPMFYFNNNTSTGTTASISLGYLGTSGNLTTAATEQLSRAAATDSYTASIAIQYNPATDLATYYLNGTSVATQSYTGAIGGIWFKYQDNASGTSGSGYELSNLTLATAVPEPASVGLLACTISFLLRRKRRATA